MSLFSGLQARAGVTMQSLWGAGFESPLHGGSEAQAMRLAAVYGAWRMIADGVASLPLRAHMGVQGEQVQRIQLPELVAMPAAYATEFGWKHQIVVSLVARGNTYGLVTNRDRDGRPSRVEILHPDLVALDGEDDVYRWQGRPLRWLVEGRPTTEVVHLPNFLMPGRVLGISPVQAFKETTEAGLYAQKFGRDWFQNGSIPAAVLEGDQKIPTDDEARILKERVQEGAVDRKPIVLGGGVKYRQISVAANESQFLETMQATATQIATIYGVPPEDIGGTTGESLTYATQESKAARFVQFSLRPYMVRIEQWLSGMLAPGKEVAFDANALIRTETLARYQSHRMGLEDGWLNKNEVRAEEGRDPLPDGQGDEYLTKDTKTPVAAPVSAHDPGKEVTP